MTEPTKEQDQAYDFIKAITNAVTEDEFPMALVNAIATLTSAKEAAEAERDRLATDALVSLAGAGVTTPEGGYLKEPHCLTGDIQKLAWERDRAKAEVERLRPFEPMILSHSIPTDVRVACARGFLGQLVLSLEALNGDAPNYTTTEITSVEHNLSYEVMVRRRDKPTPHELRMKAEAERDRLRKAIQSTLLPALKLANGIIYDAMITHHVYPSVGNKRCIEEAIDAAAALAAPTAEGGGA